MVTGVFAALGFIVKELVFLVSYVKNNAFPQPLSNSEEKKYLDLMAEGDEHARNMLIEHNLRLVAHIVKKFENTGEDFFHNKPERCKNTCHHPHLHKVM